MADIYFRKTKEKWGELSNMAAGFPIVVNDINVRTSEAFYQACRFPQHPEIQQEIIDQRSPMAAKFVAKKHIALTRPNWDDFRLEIMWNALVLKLACNREKFGAILEETGNNNIYELSHKDRYWGVVPNSSGGFDGMNILGKLLEQLREIHREGFDVKDVLDPIRIDLFLGQQIVQCGKQ